MRTRARLFKLCRALVGRLAPRAAPLHSALWLRLLKPTDLDALTDDSYTSRAGSGFDGAAHNQSGLWPWEEAAFRAALRPGAAVLVAGAGGGREMLALERMGFRADGFDASADLVAAGQALLDATGSHGSIHHAPPGRAPAGLGDYDALIVGRGVYHHIARAERRIAFLAECGSHLRAGAPLVLGDVLSRRDDPRARPRRGAVEAGDELGSAFFHRFSDREIETELAAAGFERVEVRVTPFEGNDAMAHAIAWRRG